MRRAAALVVLLAVAGCGKPPTYAVLETDKGRIVARLFPEKAPKTVAHVSKLAAEGWYDGLVFHRVIPGLLIQTGDKTGTGFGDPKLPVPDELDPEAAFDRPGLLGMASWGPGTSQTQFFVTLGPAPDLDGRHTLFGEVVEGLDAARALAAVPRDETSGSDRPLRPPKLRSLKVSTARP